MTASAIQAPAPGVPTAGPTPAPRWEVTLRRLAICIALYAVPVSVLVNPVRDWDMWWHLRTGQWIEENHTVPTTDPFTNYGMSSGRRWLAYSWLFELLIAKLYEFGVPHYGGLTGILIYRVVMGLAFVFAVHALIARRVRHFLRGILLTGVTFFALLPLLQERSWMFSLLFYTWTLDAVLSLRAGRGSRIVWLLPLLYALWANLHIQFVNGLFLLGLACAAPIIDRLFRLGVADDTAATAGTRAWWRLVALTAACTAATLINPYHVHLYVAVLELPTQAGAYQLIDELQSLSFRFATDWVLLGLFAAAMFALGRRRRINAFDCLLLGTSAYFSFHARRDLWLVVLASAAVLVGRRPVLTRTEDRFPITAPRALVLLAAVAALVFGLAWKRDLSEEHLHQEAAKRFPFKAAQFVQNERYPGPIWNNYDWGGYLIWRLPQYKAAIDGRANLHGDERMRRSLKTQDGLPGWDRDPDLMNARVIFVPSVCALAQILEEDKRWKLVYKDDVAFVFSTPDPPGPEK